MSRIPKSVKEAKWCIAANIIFQLIFGTLIYFTPFIHLLYQLLGAWSDIPLVTILLPNWVTLFFAYSFGSLFAFSDQAQRIVLIPSFFFLIILSGLEGYLLFYLFTKVTVKEYKESLKKAKYWLLAGAAWGLVSTGIIFLLLEYGKELARSIDDICIVHFFLPGLYFAWRSSNWLFVSLVSVFLSALEAYVLFLVFHKLRELFRKRKVE